MHPRIGHEEPDIVIALGASVGGTDALRELLAALPADCPGVLVVQHMPEPFTRAFAERLNGVCQISVREAVDGDQVLAGHALIAPGNQHMRLARERGVHTIRLGSDPPVRRHRPSVDVLFSSCAQVAGARAIGIIMTGMGDDGAEGLLAMRRMGARTLAQDEATSAVFGMARVAISLDAAEMVLPLGRLAEMAVRLARRHPTPI
jgi:two-component system, chemotaxis family, protein-glutamate methylesterase/glutaminase